MKMEERETAGPWLIWGSFMGALPMYGVAGFLVRSQSKGFSPGLLPMMMPVLLVLAVAVSILLLIFRFLLAGRVNYSTYCILRWACSDSIGIYGFNLFLFGTSWPVFAGFLAWAFVFHLSQMPTQADRQGFELAKR